MKRMLRRGLAAMLLLMLAACGSHTSAPAPRPPYAGIKIGKPYEVYGKWYEPEYNSHYDEIGMASWYGPGFHGGHTANGERYDQDAMTAAHRTLPMPSIVRVTNLDNGLSAVIKVNDRGPFAHDRIIDLSRASAKKLGVIRTGTAKVRVQFLEQETHEYVQNLENGTQFAMNEIKHVNPEEAGEREEAGTRPTVKVQTRMFGQPAAPITAQATAPVEDEFSVIEVPPPSMTPPVPAPEARYTPATYETPVPPPAHGAFIPPVASTGYFIQAGTFGLERNAHKIASRIGEEQSPQIVQILLNGKKYYRVMVGPFESRNDAKNMLSKLASAGISDAKIISN